MRPYVWIYCSFDIFCTIGTVLGPMYFSTAVASAGCFFVFFLVVISLPVLKFWVMIFFSLLPEIMIGIYARLSLRKQHQTPRYLLSLLTLTILWQSSAIFWSVRSGSFSNFDETMKNMKITFWLRAFYCLAKRINWLIPVIKFLKPVQPKQIFCVFQYEDYGEMGKAPTTGT